MCIICIGDYDISLTELNCSNCNSIKEIPKELVNLVYLRCYYTEIKEIPKELVNLKHISCFGTEIKEIPKELVNLTYLDCGETGITKIPRELVKLTELGCESCQDLEEISKKLVNLINFDCYDTKIKEIPKELINLRDLDCRYSDVKKIPKELVNLKNVKMPLDCVWDKRWIKTEDEKNKSRDLSIVVAKIKEKTIKIENILEFTENNSFPKEKNKDFIKVCKKIIRKNNKLQHLLEEIKFIKSLGKKGCNYFFSFIQYIYALFFPGSNFFQESYIKPT